MVSNRLDPAAIYSFKVKNGTPEKYVFSNLITKAQKRSHCRHSGVFIVSS